MVDYSTSSAFLSTKLTREERSIVAVDLALLPRLYGEDYDNIAYSLMEAYLWSNGGKNSLRKIGWLEGNIVIVDFSKQDRQNTGSSGRFSWRYAMYAVSLETGKQ